MRICIVLKRISHILLAFLLLISATGMTVSLHYCNHALYDIGILTRAASCCMPDENVKGMAAHDHCTTELQQKGHCKDETLTVSSVDDFLASASDADYNVQFTYLIPGFMPVSPGLCLRPYAWRLEEIPERNNAPPGAMSEPSFLQSFLI